MKYAMRIHEGQAKSNEINKKRVINIGDLFMCLSVKRIYEMGNIQEKDIKQIQTYDFEEYDGEYVVLPMNFYESTLAISSRILPVFLALSLEWEQEWSEQDINLLRRFSPIGCRDEQTMRELHKRGIDAYLNGCLVATFPKREINTATQKKVFLVDPHTSILDKIPEELRKKSVEFSHEYFTTMKEFLGDKKDIFEYAESVIEMYSKEAKMIITSRFHGAVIALALGIPVILVMDNFYFKYTWIKKYIPVYEPKDIDTIDWNPEPVCIPDEEKELMIRIACNRIKQTYDKYYDMCTLSEKRESIEIRNFEYLFYGEEAIRYVENNWDEETEIEYSFWGVTHTAYKLHEFIVRKCPKAKLVNVYDMVVKNRFLGVEPKLPEKLVKDNPRFVFVTADSAAGAARIMFQKMGKDAAEYFLCTRKNDLT